MGFFLGTDTSNYTTSIAVYDSDTGEMQSLKKLLPVKQGQLGLRQSDAVFHHNTQLPELIEEMFGSRKLELTAVSASLRPCDYDGSYMPCFSVGTSFARNISAVCNVPLYYNSHQQGHIAAVLFGAKRTELFSERFIAFHVSGGTTQAVLVSPSEDKIIETTQIARSLDLNAGQVIDRLGGMLSLPFPSGKYIDALAGASERSWKIKPFMRDANCSLSGLENKCEKMLKENCSAEDTAKYCISYIEASLGAMLDSIIARYGELPVVFSGGVMSNSIIRRNFSQRYDGVFASPEYSADNAVGTCILGCFKESGIK